MLKTNEKQGSTEKWDKQHKRVENNQNLPQITINVNKLIFN